MEKNIAIKVDNISKVFLLRQPKTDENGNALYEHLALKDISFEIKKGESVGIIGPNGSGKSTLLKILAGITKPTRGEVTIYGKVASILDISAGFHPELSGRENIFLNGQIHGFSRKEITSRFDKIVAFSGIEQFIDEPVKNYSNGMYLRLAFSIMIHLDFDVYLLDEVLSVGDMEFRLKTKEQFNLLLKTGKTVMFVSHNVSELANLSQYIQLEKGSLNEKSGNIELLSKYIEETVIRSGVKLRTKNLEINDFSDFPQRDNFKIKKIVFSQEADPEEEFVSNKPFFLDIHFSKNTEDDTIDIILNITDDIGETILVSSTILNENGYSNTEKGEYVVRCIIPENLLGNKIYCLNLSFFKDAERIIGGIKNYDVTMEDFEKIRQTEVKAMLNLTQLIYFKPKMMLLKKYNLSKFNLTNASLTPIFEWQIKKYT